MKSIRLYRQLPLKDELGLGVRLVSDKWVSSNEAMAILDISKSNLYVKKAFFKKKDYIENERYFEYGTHKGTTNVGTFLNDKAIINAEVKKIDELYYSFVDLGLNDYQIAKMTYDISPEIDSFLSFYHLLRGYSFAISHQRRLIALRGFMRLDKAIKEKEHGKTK